MREVGADPRHLLISHQVLFMQCTPSVWCLHVAAEQRAGLALHSETDPLLTCTHAASQNSHVAACIPHCTLKFCRVPWACAFHGDNRWRLTVIHMLISGFMRQGCQYKTCNKLPAFTLSHWRQKSVILFTFNAFRSIWVIAGVEQRVAVLALEPLSTQKANAWFMMAEDTSRNKHTCQVARRI